jgi:hypothetical protein
MQNKILLTLALALTACGQSYTAVSPAEALELASLHGPHYDLTVEVLDSRLLDGCERAEWWAPAAAILCVEGSTGLPGAVALDVGCHVPEGNWGWTHGYGEVCIIDTPRAIGCTAIVPHELGHALGAPHTPRGAGLMASPSACDADITETDLGLVAL